MASASLSATTQKRNSSVRFGFRDCTRVPTFCGSTDGILTAQLPIEGEVARPPRDKPEKRAKSPPAAPVAPVKPAKVKKPKKPFVVKDTALKLVDEIAGAEERAVEEKLAKDAEKQTALEQRSAERAEKEERRQKFKVGLLGRQLVFPAY